jgi:hypothetical protein
MTKGEHHIKAHLFVSDYTDSSYVAERTKIIVASLYSSTKARVF